MKSVAVLLAVSLIATGSVAADQRQSTAYGRVKEDVPAVKNNTLCVYADVSKTGKKTIVCGDPAPPTLAALLAAKSESVVIPVTVATATAAAAAAVTTAVTTATTTVAPAEENAAAQRRAEERCSGDKKKSHSTSVALFVQPQHEQQVHYVQPPQYQPAADVYQRPQVYYRPFDLFQKPDETAVRPLRPLCSRPGDYDGSAMVDGLPTTLFRTVDASRFVHDLTAVRGEMETYDRPTAGLTWFGGRPITVIRPIPLMTPPFFKADYDTGIAAPDAMSAYRGQSGHRPASVVPRTVRVPTAARRSYGRFDADPDRRQFDGHAVRPETQDYWALRRGSDVHTPDVGERQKPDPSSGGNVVVNEPPAESAQNAQNVKQTSDAPTRSDPKDDNGAQPSQQKKAERMTRN